MAQCELQTVLLFPLQLAGWPWPSAMEEQRRKRKPCEWLVKCAVISAMLCALLAAASISLSPMFLGHGHAQSVTDEVWMLIYCSSDVKALLYYAFVAHKGFHTGDFANVYRLTKGTGVPVQKRLILIQITICAVAISCVATKIKEAFTSVTYFSEILQYPVNGTLPILNGRFMPWANIAAKACSSTAAFVATCFFCAMLGTLLRVDAALEKLNDGVLGTITEGGATLAGAVERHVHAHHRFCGTVRATNGYMRAMFLAVFAAEIAILIVAIFGLLTSNGNGYIMVLGMIAHSLVTIVPLSLAASSVNERMQETMRIVYDRLPPSRENAEMIQWVNDYAARMSMSSCNWAITCYQIFPINRSALLTLTSIVLTYTTLLWQLQ